ncbi:hypothetical protein I2W78_06865 [Streptomyces spinoverrucosus]|uniref:hypothetical protein n=1 Tax=Streptomyces spinoverrucosus TaxID=284043 RepID=UPI0018C3957E|nr:hypothetical protein [Streptomyces spinoverrucosus]MBG0851571.1 hypothetical protein [Streptomyces spinoverrucosus]
MLQTRELFDSLTTAGPLRSEVLARAVSLLSECEEATTACAAAMLAGKDADELRAAIVQDLDCADVTAATRRVLTRGGHDRTLLAAQVEACLIACRLSHDLCAAHHEHCRICAESTEQAVDVCREVLAAVRS